jgi:O-methyltransferase involved in polyketide biosynthesis
MNGVNKTLYIPLYGKALVSNKGIILNDKRAEEIWDKAGFPLKGKSKSKWLAYFMGMRARVFDEWVKEKALQYPDSTILHLGCGLDSRAVRVCVQNQWYDVDFPSVIDERKCYYAETENYRMLAHDIKDAGFCSSLVAGGRAIVVLEGVSMYLKNEELQTLLARLNERFENLSVLVDCYTPFAAKMSKIKNPINDVGVYEVYGIENAVILQKGTGLSFVKEKELTPQYLINELQGFEKNIFKTIYAGRMSKKLYKLYEYES